METQRQPGALLVGRDKITPKAVIEALKMPDSSVYVDPVIEALKRDVDRTLLRENLKLTPQERFEKLENFVQFAEELRRADRKASGQDRKT
jgi:hypothetical protein